MIAYVLITYGVMSLVSLTLYSIDKINSILQKNRIPEIILIIVSAFGGILGTILGMVFLNHKSNMSHKWYFLCTILTSFLVQLFILIYATGAFII